MLYPEDIGIDEFLETLAMSDTRLEFVAGKILDFAGGTVAHGVLTTAIVTRLAAAARPPCRAYTSDVAIRVANKAYVFPDASVSCEPIHPTSTTLAEPSVIVEVISASSVRRDRVEKLDLYQSLATVQEYVLIDSRRRWVRVYERTNDGWIDHTYETDDAIVKLKTAPVSVPIADLYEGIP